MTEAFKKAMDLAFPNIVLNKIRPKELYDQGTVKAYEWLTDPENNLGAYSDSLKPIVERQKLQSQIIEKLIGALEKADGQIICPSFMKKRPFHKARRCSYCTAAKKVSKTLSEVKEMMDE